MQDIRKIWDVKSLLHWSQEYFTSKGINQPKLSSELLLAAALNFTRMQIYLNFDHRPAEKELAIFKEYILKRVGHMPIQYILQKAFFRNLELYVDENVLIPRPETELLVDRVLNIMSDMVRQKAAGTGDFSGTDMPDISLNILEIGTGSGAVALSLIKEAKHFIAKSLVSAGRNGLNKINSQGNEPAGSRPDSANSSAGSEGPGTFNALQATEIASVLKLKLTATEKSQAALEVALRNAKNLLTDEEIQNADFIQADVVPSENPSFISEFREKINIVVSNPPYISEKNYASLPQEVRGFEPEGALLAGKTGLEIYKRIIKETLGLCAVGNSFFVFEIDPYVALSLQKIFSESMGIATENIEIYRDYNQLERVIVVKI